MVDCVRTSNGPRHLQAQKLALVFGFFAFLGAWCSQAYQLPTEKIEYSKVRPSSAIEIVDTKDRVIDYWYEKNLRLYRPLAEMDSKLVDYVVLLEDAKFYTHGGFDIDEIKNSIEKNVEKGKVKRGASTITQQLVKNLFLDRERSFTRKLFEIPWALRVENDLSKKQILDLYLNIIEWGPGVYGAEAAARHFFDRSARQLDIGQALYLALIIPSPKRFDLFANPRTEDFINKKRRDFVGRLVHEKKITADLKETYLNAPFGLVAPDSPERHFIPSHQAAYFGNHLKKPAWLKEIEKNLRGKSFKVKSLKLSLDFDLQTRVSDWQEVSVPEASNDRFVLVKESEQIRAYRKFKKGRGPDPVEVESVGTEMLTIEEAQLMPWKSLAL